jgi:ketosteroid isomerase-like protein
VPPAKPCTELLKAAYEAFNSRDIEKILAMMHPNVDWPNMIEGGRIRGRDGIRDYWQRQFNLANPRVDPVAFQDEGAGRTVVDVHQVVRDLSGKVVLDRMVQHVYLVRDGLIERMDVRETASLTADAGK